jgi:hypothetical protein
VEAISCFVVGGTGITAWSVQLVFSTTYPTVIALRVSNLVGPYPGWLLVSFSSYRNVCDVLIRGLLILRSGSLRKLKLLLYVHRLTLSNA